MTFYILGSGNICVKNIILWYILLECSFQRHMAKLTIDKYQSKNKKGFGKKIYIIIIIEGRFTLRYWNVNENLLQFMLMLISRNKILLILWIKAIDTNKFCKRQQWLKARQIQLSIYFQFYSSGGLFCRGCTVVLVLIFIHQTGLIR